MRNFRILVFALVALAPSLAFAEAIVNQQASRGDAATFMASTSAPATSCSTINTTTANGTVTITPPSGQSAYITSVEVDSFSDATGNTTSAVLTWAGLSNPNGTAPVIAISNVAAAVAQNSTIHYQATYNPPLKGQTSTTVTLTPSAQLSHMILCPRVLGYFAP